MKLSKRSVLKWAGLGAGGFLAYHLARPAVHLWRIGLDSKKLHVVDIDGYADDASRLNRTRIKARIVLSGTTSIAESEVSRIFGLARQNGDKVSFAGSQHTMGGHTIASNGYLLDTSGYNGMNIDKEKMLLRVQSGAKWSRVIEYLDEAGCSVAVMQSNNDFSVAGTLGANAHGWQTRRAPFGSTVQSFRLVKPDGQTLKCSRTMNSELFSLVIGGYGLFGFVSEVIFSIVKNQMYKAKRYPIPTQDYASFFQATVDVQKDLGFVYGRLSVRPDSFLEDALIYTFTETGENAHKLSEVESENATIKKLKRLVFRGSEGSDYGKKLRWNSEVLLSEQVGRSTFSRNELLNESAANIMNFASDTTDILHEYFVPFEKFHEFTLELRKAVLSHSADLLNVTVRDVKTDSDSFMKYARTDCLSLVLLFVQKIGEPGESKMQSLTRSLIDIVLKLGGTYYLPYRLHATSAQLGQAYPMAHQFFDLKRKYDPSLILQNAFWEGYGDDNRFS